MNPAETRENLKRFITGLMPQQPVICTVESVDLTKKTCSCIPVDGSAEIPFARLQAKAGPGLLIVPEVGSQVKVSFTGNGSPFVDIYSSFSSMEINGTTYGGITIADNETARLNLIENKINLIVAALSAWSPVAGDGGAALKALVVPPSTITTPLVPTVSTQLQNLTIKHGNGT